MRPLIPFWKTLLARIDDLPLLQVHPVHYQTGGTGRSLARPTAAPNREWKVVVWLKVLLVSNGA